MERETLFQSRDEVVAAAMAFVASTSFYRQPKECREQFERLAVAVLDLEGKDLRG